MQYTVLSFQPIMDKLNLLLTTMENFVINRQLLCKGVIYGDLNYKDPILAAVRLAGIHRLSISDVVKIREAAILVNNYVQYNLKLPVGVNAVCVGFANNDDCVVVYGQESVEELSNLSTGLAISLVNGY